MQMPPDPRMGPVPAPQDVPMPENSLGQDQEIEAAIIQYLAQQGIPPEAVTPEMIQQILEQMLAEDQGPVTPEMQGDANYLENYMQENPGENAPYQPGTPIYEAAPKVT